MKILVSYRGATRIREWETGALIAKAFRNLGHEVFEYASVYETGQWLYDPKSVIEQGPFDLHLFMEKNDGANQYPELAGLHVKKSFAWLFDTAMNELFYEGLINGFRFDHVFCANPEFIKNQETRSWLPYAADRDYFFRHLGVPKTRDICLVGSDRPERQALMAALNSAGLKAELISGVFKENYINELAKSRIIVNDAAGGGTALLSMRCFEATAAGSLLVQANTSKLEEVFRPGLECLDYFNLPELIWRCEDALANKIKYEFVRAHGYHKCMEKHTYENRAKTILELV